MARYIINKAQFKPYSFDEYLKPYQLMTDEYNLRESLLGQLEEGSAEIEAELQPNTRAHSIYTNYMSDLKKASDDLADLGLKGVNRKNIYNLANRYKSEIENIKNASTAYKTMLKEREELVNRDPSIRFYTQYQDLSDFLDGKVADNSYISGATIEALIGGLATDWAAKQDPTITRKLTKDGQNYENYTTQGASLDDLANVVRSGYTSDHGLSEIVRTLKEQYNYDNLSDEQKQIFDVAAQKGIYKGLGKTTLDLTSNQNFESSYIKYQNDLLKHNLRKLKVESGELPYRYDEDTKTAYYHDATLNKSWEEKGVTRTEDKEGNYTYTRSAKTAIQSFVEEPASEEENLILYDASQPAKSIDLKGYNPSSFTSIDLSEIPKAFQNSVTGTFDSNKFMEVSNKEKADEMIKGLLEKISNNSAFYDNDLNKLQLQKIILENNGDLSRYKFSYDGADLLVLEDKAATAEGDNKLVNYGNI